MSTGSWPGSESDTGLQPQRTALAWRRTGLAVLGNALLTAVIGLRLGSLALTLVAAAVATVLAVLALVRTSRDRPGRPERTGSPWPALVAVAVAAVVLGLGGATAAAVELAARR